MATSGSATVNSIRSGPNPNRRKATVYTHPTGANCCVNLVRDTDDAFNRIRHRHDRALSLTIIFSGFAEKYPDINWIWSHGGGSTTAFYERFTVQALMRPLCRKIHPRSGRAADPPLTITTPRAVPNEVTLSALQKMVPISQIVYGTDYPYRTAADHTKGVSALRQGRRPESGRSRECAAADPAAEGGLITEQTRSQIETRRPEVSRRRAFCL